MTKDKFPARIAYAKAFRARQINAKIQIKKPNYSILHSLVIGIEAICDVGGHMLNYYFGRKADSYKDIIVGLAETGVIPNELVKESKEMTSFRNLVIHIYLDVDLKRVYKYIPLAMNYPTLCFAAGGYPFGQVRSLLRFIPALSGGICAKFE